MSTNPTPAARTAEPNTQHTDIDDNLEPNCPLDDIIPFDLDSDMTVTRPCAYCGHTDESCRCDDADGPFSHIAHRRGW